MQAGHRGSTQRGWSSIPDRYVLWALALATLLCTLIAPSLDPDQWAQRRWAFLGDRALDGLLEQAQLPLHADTPKERLSLSLQGMKLTEPQARGLREAMARHPGVNEQPKSPHRLLASAHRWGPIAAVELRLFRRGWVLCVQELERMVHAAWLPPFSLLVAALLCLGLLPRLLPSWLTMPVAAATAQAILAWLRRGEPYRAIPVHWTEWPSREYERAMTLWRELVFAKPELSCACACGMLLLAAYLSHRARARGQARSAAELMILGLWAVSSLVWWDAGFRCTLPLTAIEGSGASLMRVSHALRGAAWACTALMVWRSWVGQESKAQAQINPTSQQ